MILVSACLAGLSCRYDGTACAVEWVCDLVASGRALPFCPEQLGGMATPREPAELRLLPRSTELAVFSRSGSDLTSAYRRGAEEGLKLARLAGASVAILKEKSPSCGVRRVYSGLFDGELRPGEGLTARLFREASMTLFSDEEEALWRAFSSSP